MKNLTVDLNCDMGESFGNYRLGHDEEILNYVSASNIACGYHAGDPTVMRNTVQLALQKGVALGAHPGLPDLAGFGRREMAVTPREVHDLILYQLGALWAIAKAEGGTLKHVKPHGALYTMAANNPLLAQAIAEAVYKLEPELILYGLAGSELIREGQKIGLRTAQEVFADRTYQHTGRLTPRTHPDALLTDPAVAVGQVLEMIQKGRVKSLQGIQIAIQADTVCIHGDGVHALAFTQRIHDALKKNNISIQAPTF